MTAWTLPLAGFWLAAVNHLWQCTLVLAVLWLFDRAWLRRAPAAARADLWTLGLAKLLVPAALGGLVTTVVTGLLPSDLPRVGTVVAGVLAPAPPPTAGLAPWWGTVLVLVTAVWFAGALVALIRLGRDLVRQSRLARGARPATGRRLLAACERAGVPRDGLVVAPRVELPLVQGWRRACILMPPRLEETLTGPELESLLRHEECHRRRRDPLRLLAGRVAGVPLWFYPPLHWLLRRLHECSEYACDEAALAADVPAATYARALARTIRRGLEATAPVAAASGGGPDLMRRRLVRLARRERPAMKYRRPILFVAAVVVTAAVFVPLDVVAQTPPPPPPPPKAAPPREAPPAPPPRAGDAPPASEAPPAPETPERLVRPPELVTFVAPEYPEAARKARAGGTVQVKVLVAADGGVERAEIGTGVPDHPELDEAALAAARKCVFTAGTVDGEPAAMWMMIPFVFAAE